MPKTKRTTAEILKRIEGLRSLKDGWVDGEGRAVSSYVCDLARTVITDAKWFRPYMYPTFDGGLNLEWDVELDDCTEYHELQLNPDKSVRYWYFMDTLESDQDPNDELDLDMTWQNPKPSDIIHALEIYNCIHR